MYILIHLSQGLDIEYPIVIDADDEVITAVPRFTPLEVTSMMKESLDRSGGIVRNQIVIQSKVLVSYSHASLSMSEK